MRSRLLQSEKLSVMGELISGVAHELNNPLTGVIGYSPSSCSIAPDSAKARSRNVERIHYEARRCHRIVQNLLAFAQATALPVELGIGERSAGGDSGTACLSDARGQHLAGARVLPGLAPHPGDSHQLQQVFVNLLNNAQQSMAATGRGGVLTVSTRRIEDRVMIRFADNGPGIPEDVRHRIFEPFFTTKEVSKGTGLGLSLCHGIIQDHGGTISVTSRSGVETIFVVELPADSATAAVGSGLEVPAREAEVQEKERRILVVDDEETILEFLSEALRVRGHEVDCAANGLHALDRMRDQEYDAVITDMKMPGMSGRQTLRGVVA